MYTSLVDKLASMPDCREGSGIVRDISCHIKITALQLWYKLSSPKIYHREDIRIHAFCIMIGALAHKWSAPCDVNFTQNTRPMQSVQSHEATYTTTPPTVIPGEHHLHRDETFVSLPGMGEHHPALLLNDCCHLLC